MAKIKTIPLKKFNQILDRDAGRTIDQFLEGKMGLERFLDEMDLVDRNWRENSAICTPDLAEYLGFVNNVFPGMPQGIVNRQKSQARVASEYGMTPHFGLVIVCYVPVRVLPGEGLVAAYAEGIGRPILYKPFVLNPASTVAEPWSADRLGKYLQDDRSIEQPGPSDLALLKSKLTEPAVRA